MLAADGGQGGRSNFSAPTDLTSLMPLYPALRTAKRSSLNRA